MAFNTKYNHFKYLVMLFDFSNLPTSFQEYISKIYIEKLNIIIVVYIDDILIYIKYLE